MTNIRRATLPILIFNNAQSKSLKSSLWWSPVFHHVQSKPLKSCDVGQEGGSAAPSSLPARPLAVPFMEHGRGRRVDQGSSMQSNMLDCVLPRLPRGWLGSTVSHHCPFGLTCYTDTPGRSSSSRCWKLCTDPALGLSHGFSCGGSPVYRDVPWQGTKKSHPTTTA